MLRWTGGWIVRCVGDVMVVEVGEGVGGRDGECWMGRRCGMFIERSHEMLRVKGNDSKILETCGGASVSSGAFWLLGVTD